jgi:hypothetical protein
MPRRQRQQQDAVNFIEPNDWFSEEEDDNFFYSACFEVKIISTFKNFTIVLLSRAMKPSAVVLGIKAG